MATQADAFDPRAEALAASRYRSGSGKMEGLEAQPPATGPEPGASSAAPGKATASTFRNLRTKFEEKDAAAAGQATRTSNSSLFGSSVSRMKQRFQPLESRDGELASGPASRPRANDRSPENKRKKASEGHGSALAPALNPKRRTCSVDSAQHHHPVYVSPPLSPTHMIPPAKAPPTAAGPDCKTKQGTNTVISQKPADQVSEPALTEPTNHVQRFNYTMALFARMEEETKRAQERDKVARRKVSPSRLSITSGGTPSPLLSPSAPENQSFPSPNTDSLQRARRSKSIPQESEPELTSSRPLSDSMTQAAIPADVAEDVRLRSHFGSDGTETPEDTGGQGTRIDFGKHSEDPDLIETKIPEVSSSRALETSARDKASVPEDPDLRPTSVLPHSSRLEHSTRPSLRAQHQAKVTHSPGLSSSAPASASSSPHSRTSGITKYSGQSVSSSSLPSVTASVVDAEVVTLRPHRSPKTDNDTAKKRLSREEIESALERADTYLANLESVPDTPPVKKSEYQRPTGSATAAARRRFLYGDAASSSPSPPSSSSSSPSKRRSAEQEDGQQCEPISADVMVAHQAGSQHSAAPTSSSNSGVTFNQLNSLPSDVADDGVEAEKERLPPPYHEATEPPPYEVATSSASMLISQRVSQSEQQTSNQSGVSVRPVPVPRRAAPPVPQHPPASRVTPPPPAPEPGSGENVRNLHTQGSRQGLVLDKDSADDLVMPEEHIAHHSRDG